MLVANDIEEVASSSVVNRRRKGSDGDGLRAKVSVLV
jgi:hypothetical protein